MMSLSLTHVCLYERACIMSSCVSERGEANERSRSSADLQQKRNPPMEWQTAVT